MGGGLWWENRGLERREEEGKEISGEGRGLRAHFKWSSLMFTVRKELLIV